MIHGKEEKQNDYNEKGRKPENRWEEDREEDGQEDPRLPRKEEDRQETDLRVRSKGSSIKGVSVVRAKPSNAIDAYDLYKKAFREGVFPYPQPSERQLSEYHFGLMEELAQPNQVLLLAKKGRAYLGLVHAVIIPRPMGKSPYICFIKLIYVADKKRNLGIGRKLISSLKEICRDWGVSTFEFMCEDRHIEYWKKEQGARKVSTLMVVED